VACLLVIRKGIYGKIKHTALCRAREGCGYADTLCMLEEQGGMEKPALVASHSALGSW
jgi:hypothetical protein